jgi:hypothetical protein
MKMIAEYLEKAIHFERMADQESDAKLKAELLAQAKSYKNWPRTAPTWKACRFRHDQIEELPFERVPARSDKPATA